jgi:hypothetical protein
VGELGGLMRAPFLRNRALTAARRTRVAAGRQPFFLEQVVGCCLDSRSGSSHPHDVLTFCTGSAVDLDSAHYCAVLYCQLSSDSEIRPRHFVMIHDA